MISYARRISGWRMNGNLTYNKNQVVRLAGRDTIVSGIIARIVGKPVTVTVFG